MNRFKWRAWCRSKLHCTVENFWKKVIFSDETQIVLGKGSTVHVWWKECEQWAPYCLGEGRDWQPRVVASVMFWGYITHEGVGTFVPVDGTINSEKYIQILDDNLWPVAAKHFLHNPWIFQDDNATPHRSRITTQWKQDNNLPVMTWPAQSPDINIIENLWRYLKIRLQRRAHLIRSKKDLINTATSIWTSMTPTFIKSLNSSIPKRIRNVLRVNGAITNY